MKTRLVGLLPPLAIALSEGGWVAVVYAAVDRVALNGQAALGLWPFVAAVAVGLTIARLAGDVDARLHPLALALLVLGVGFMGALLDALLGGRPINSPLDLVTPGAVMSGIAVWRGAAHWRPEDDELSLSGMLGLGVPALIVPWLIALPATGQQRDDFVAIALPGTLLFIGAGLAAIGLTRLAALSRDTGVDWRTNRSWLALLAGVLAGLLLVAAPAAWLLGVPLGSLFGRLTDPLRGLVQAGSAVVHAVATGTGLVPPPQAEPTGPAEIGLLPTTGMVGLISILPLLASAVLLILLFIAVMHAQATKKPRPPAVAYEESALELPRLSLRRPHLPALHLPRRSPRPRTAGEAYLAALRDLAAVPELARAASESPRSHARRIEAAAGWRFRMLAGDYELERYAGTPLSRAETSRALRRSDDIRRRGPRAG